MKKYTIPDWVNEFIENKYLENLDKLEPHDRAMRLYNVGRLPLDEVQPYAAAKIPEQDEDGRYRKEAPANWGGDELMFHIRDAQEVQELLSNIVRGRPKRPFTFVPVWTPREIEARTRARNWDTGAWGAGSHAGCDIYVLYMNVKMGLEQYRPAYEAAMAVVGALQSEKDGMWGSLQNEPFARVNGTMKLFSKVHFVQECYLPFADKVIDYVLDYCERIFPTYMSIHGTSHLCCSMIDIMFCLKYAIKMTDYRRDDIAETVYAMFPIMRELAGRNDCSLGLTQGTIRRAGLLCGLKEELGWPEKVYRFPDA